MIGIADELPGAPHNQTDENPAQEMAGQRLRLCKDVAANDHISAGLRQIIVRLASIETLRVVGKKA